MRRRRIGRIAMRIGVIVPAAYVALLAGMFMVMRQPPQRFGRIMDAPARIDSSRAHNRAVY